MRFMLDTNICIYIIKKNPDSLFARFEKISPGDLCISAITYSELQYGVAKSSRVTQNQAALNEFLAPLAILDYPVLAAPLYGLMKASLASSGKIIGPNDLLIAAHALAINAVLITNNEKEFSRIPDLKLENWA